MFESQLIFPLNGWHNHAPSLVECPNGDLLACWFSGSGERTADDVQILGARRRRGRWSQPFVMADTPDYPDCNPILFLDSRRRLWLVWITVLNHRWEGSLLKYRISTDYQRALAPRWSMGDVIHISPDAPFVERTEAWLRKLESQGALLPAPLRARQEVYLQTVRQRLHDELSRRLGWMTRTLPLIDGERIHLPLYSDGFSFSLVAVSDDGGVRWRASAPILGAGAVQPALLRRRDGALVAYMRDNGPPPNRVFVAYSHDNGASWSEAEKTALPNPGSSVAALALHTGEWLLIGNDTEQGRHQLAVWLSEDEGRNWRVAGYLEQDEPGCGRYAYPCAIQTRDGAVHVVYSYALERADLPRDEQGRPKRSSIKWARFDRAWLYRANAE
ncbi:MAG: exo-alpha-sialidase [Fimbriimonadales bacterium]|nr:exo-alpha-sialidase [Fimbriimonadales bacterium]